uniref:Transforming growth factor beta mimic 5 n=1 Tax=Heligmosomoides polygyrus bakeri TaxID=375939 RepID=A0A2P1IQ79_HELBE|nr:transforming growth factor beta mimic 5 [Heligmosomoides bakeri]
MLLTVVIGLLEVAATDDSGCMPFSDEAATYKYVAKGPKNIEIPAQIDNSGMYPDYTHVKRFCKGLHGEDTTGWFVGIGPGSEWVYYQGVQECGGRGCLPLSTDDTVTFEYLKATVNPGIIFNITVHPDATGKYPELTYIKRICKNFPTDSKVQGHIIGMCYNAEWRFSSTPTSPSIGCPPLPDDGIVFHEYYGYAGDRHTVGPAVTKDSSGNYPSPTHARRRCRALSQKADPGEFVGICYRCGTTGESHWDYYSHIRKCPDPRGCNSDDLFDKLGFEGVMVREEEGSDSYKDDFARFYATGSKVNAECKGNTVRLECSNGEWHDPGTKTVHRCTKEGLRAP